MKRITIAILAVIMLLSTAFAENADFSLPEGIEWGATSEQLLAAVGTGAYVDRSDEATFITMDNAPVMGISTQITYVFPYDVLYAWGFTASAEAISAEEVTNALASEYGEYRDPDIELIQEVFSPFADGEGLVDMDMLLSASLQDFHIWDTQADAYVMMACEKDEINVLFIGRQVAPAILEAREEYEKARAEGGCIFDEENAIGLIAAMYDGYANVAKKHDDLTNMLEYVRESSDEFLNTYVQFHYSLPASPPAMGVIPEFVLEKGDIMPQSGLPLDKEACKALIEADTFRNGMYVRYANVLNALYHMPDLREKYFDEFSIALSGWLDATADINATLFRIAFIPHVETSEMNILLESLQSDYPRHQSRFNEIAGLDEGALKSNLEDLYKKQQQYFESINGVIDRINSELENAL